MDNHFLKTYFNEFKALINDDDEIINDIILAKQFIYNASKKGKKSVIVGNGGSAAIASHFSVDLTKNAKVRCINFNEADLITCFSNDYGYEDWVARAIDFYGDKGDVLIAISSSGSSKNILNGCAAAKKKKFSKIITLSGHSSNNPLKAKGDINLWVDSIAYNHVENIHQLWLLSIVDLIIGKSEYPASPIE